MAEEKTILQTLLEPLPGDETTKAVIFGTTVLIVTVIFLYLVVSLKRTKRQTEDEIISALLATSEDDVEIMVDIESDDEPVVAINMDADELIVQSVVAPRAVVVDEPEESLEQVLEAKAESGEGNSRLERRMKRKKQRELVELTENMMSVKPLPPLPELPALDAELPLPDLSNLPPPSEADLTAPPIMNIPVPQKEAKCLECAAKFTIKDLRLTKVKCPICDAVVNL